MTLVEVTAHTNITGKVLPVYFIWEGRKTPILGIGRRWNNQDGEHILAMVPDDRLIELIHAPDHSWWLKPLPEQGKRWFA